jgi:alpha/beta superfamily hydrolase
MTGIIREQEAVVPVDADVRLDARIALPGAPARGVVIAHPHPLYGGDMDNPVVVRVAEVCQAAGLATARFNFRGVGRSTGRHGGGTAERDDVLAVLKHLGALLGDPNQLALAGYSFGAVVVAAVAGQRRTGKGLALIAPPLGVAGLDRLGPLGDVSGPVLIVGASDDEYCPRDRLEGLRERTPNADVRVIEGGGHFFFGKLYPLGEIVAAWARRVAGEGV